jgi:hypothetical protein
VVKTKSRKTNSKKIGNKIAIKLQEFRRIMMLVKDLSHIEVVAEENQIQGGFAGAGALALAAAAGRDAAVTETATVTVAISGKKGSAAFSGSKSGSVAI